MPAACLRASAQDNVGGSLSSCLCRPQRPRPPSYPCSSRPTWASINCGVFVCMRCAGVHRGLGVHVSKVGRV